MKRFTAKCLILFGIICIFSASRAYAQATATVQISGVVKDPSGASVAGAVVTATQTQTGFSRSVTTGADGSYILNPLPLGEYQLQVRKEGFTTYVQNGIILQVNTNPAINVRLQLGAVSEEVRVSANAAMVETHHTAVSQVIEQQRIVGLPLNGRQATDLILLSGASASSPHHDMISSKNYPTSTTIAVAGGQGNSNNYLLDGADNNDAFSNVNLPYPFPDALQEFSVQTSSESAKYGLHPGGVVNVVTKSGTNRFHGDAFEFLRNGAVNARNFFASAADTLKRNQFGGTIGGPILHDKLFFFGGYQGTRNRQAPPTTLVHVLTPAAVSGDFSTLESSTCLSKPRTLKNPFVGGTYTNNFIDPATWDTAAVNLLKFEPVSTDPCGALRIGIPNNDDEDQEIGRVDWLQSHKQSVFVRYFITDYRLPPVFLNSDLLTTRNPGELDRSQSAVLGDTYIFSPNVVNSFHATFSRLRINRGPAPNLISPAALGVNMTDLVPNFIDITVSSHYDIGCGTCSPGHFNDNSWQITDDVTWTHGAHEIAYGGELIHNQLNELSNFKSNGEFTFNGTFTGDPIADLVLGLPSDFTQGEAEQENWRQTYFGLYLQDNYRVNQRFTVLAGLRWEPYLPTADKLHRGNLFELPAFEAGQKSNIYNNSPLGLFFHGDPGIPNAYTNGHWGDFDPRLGIVWDPQGNGRQTIRSGYGIFFDQPEIFLFDRFADSSPWGSSIDFVPGFTQSVRGFSDPYNGFTGGNPFGGNNPNAAITFPPTANQFFPSEGVYINLPRSVRPTYMQQWDLLYQRQFGGNWMISAGYLGNKTTHIWIGTEQDPAQFLTLAQCATVGISSSNCQTTKSTNQRRTLDLLGQQLFPTGFPAGSGINPGAAYSTIALLDDGDNAEYNAMLLTANHRLSQNFTILADYTYSHCIDEGDFSAEIAGPNYQNPSNRNASRGNCQFDHRHVFNASLVADMPTFQRKRAKWFLNGWETGWIFNARSGDWFNPSTGTDQSLTGVGQDRPDVVANPLAGSCPPPKGSTTPIPVGSPGCWFNTSAFAPNALGTFGNTGRDSLQGPGSWDIDMDVAKTFPVRENQRLELRGEAFNVFNHTRFDDPQGSLKSSNFGQITGAADPRILQVAVKYIF